MKKAFTLIELLAVIVILAIILFVAVPKVLLAYESSKKEAFKQNAQMLFKAIDLKQVFDETFDVLALNKDNVNEVLKTDSSNYEELIVTNSDDQINITLFGANI